MMVFSVYAVLGPALGAMTTAPVFVVIISMISLYKAWMGSSTFFVTGGLPTLGAAYALHLARHSKSASYASGIVTVVLPLACMTLFALHPAAYGLYGTYWLIPILWFFMRSRVSSSYVRIMGDALQSTFVAHAIGSALWLFLRASTPLFWAALLPQVALERFLIASAMGCSIGIYEQVVSFINRKRGVHAASCADNGR